MTDYNPQDVAAAVNLCCFDFTKRLIEDSRFDPNYNNHENLRMAVTANNLKVIRLLIEHPQIDQSDDYVRAVSDYYHCLGKVIGFEAFSNRKVAVIRKHIQNSEKDT